MSDSLFCPNCGMLKKNCVCGKYVADRTKKPYQKKANNKTNNTNNKVNNKAKNTAKGIYQYENRKPVTVSEELDVPIAEVYDIAEHDLPQEVIDRLKEEYPEIPEAGEVFDGYVVNDLLTSGKNVLMADAIDTEDETFKKWRYDETININTYLNYAISKNWINASKLQDYIESNTKYSDADEIYEALVTMVIDSLNENRTFDKLIYKYMIKAGKITGKDICMSIYEQGILSYDEAQYNNLASGSVLPYDFVRGKIETLDITPGQLGLEPCTGSMVVTDTNTGDVLACVSYPGYDNNRLANTMDSSYYNKLVTNMSRPFYNNATQEKTAPGSTYKPLSAIAGLTEGTITTSTTVYCDGSFDRVSPSIKCWVHPDEHGTQDVVNALTNSCNVFFCDLGYNMSLEDVDTTQIKADAEDGEQEEKRIYKSEIGLNVLEKYATMFGLNETSGLEIPESDPQISDDSSVPSTMGQGTNNFTTSQLARYVTAIANKGTVFNLTLLDHVEKVDGTVTKEFDAEVRSEITEVSDSTWNAVHEGMRGVVSNSSVFDKLNATDLSVAGKTGTAQQSTTHPDHGLFIGFAPSNKPEIAFAIRIANGYSSTFASEVGNDVLEYYYKITDPSEIITGTAAKITVSAHSD